LAAQNSPQKALGYASLLVSQRLILKLANELLLQLENKVKLKFINWLNQNIIWSANFTNH